MIVVQVWQEVKHANTYILPTQWCSGQKQQCSAVEVWVNLRTKHEKNLFSSRVFAWQRLSSGFWSKIMIVISIAICISNTFQSRKHLNDRKSIVSITNNKKDTHCKKSIVSFSHNRTSLKEPVSFIPTQKQTLLVSHSVSVRSPSLLHFGQTLRAIPLSFGSRTQSNTSVMEPLDVTL